MSEIEMSEFEEIKYTLEKVSYAKFISMLDTLISSQAQNTELHYKEIKKRDEEIATLNAEIGKLNFDNMRLRLGLELIPR